MVNGTRDERVLAVDLGGTNLRVAVVDADGELTHRQHAPTEGHLGPDSVLERMAALIQSVAAAAELRPDAPVGIASPGPINPHDGTVYFTPNLPGWRNVTLGPTIERLTGRVTRCANDANCAGLGEASFGAARGSRNVVYIGLGTGIGGAVVANGQLIDGHRGLGAELGHMTVAMDGTRCTCGGQGCLETYVAGWALARDAQLVATTVDGAGIVAAADGGPIHAGVLATAAERGDEMAIFLLDRAGQALGVALGTLINIFNPERVVIGGGVARVGEPLLGPARRRVRSHCFAAFRDDVTIVDAPLGDDGGLLGAAALALAVDAKTPVAV